MQAGRMRRAAVIPWRKRELPKQASCIRESKSMEQRNGVPRRIRQKP